MAIRRNGLGVKVGMGPKVGRFVSEVRIAQEVDNRNRHLPAFELWQHIIVDIRAADAGVAEEPTIGLGEQFSVDVNRRAVYHNIRGVYRASSRHSSGLWPRMVKKQC